MALALFGFLRLSLLDVLDILLISLIIFLLFRWLWGSSAWSIFVAILSLYLIRFAVTVLGMRLTATIMDMVQARQRDESERAYQQPAEQAVP